MKKISIIFICVIAILGTLWKVSKSEEFQIYGKLINRANTTDKIVALTFDDGPTVGHTDLILEILSKAGIKATFFLVGKNIEENPQETKKIIEQDHEIGNHSYSHSRMVLKRPSFIAKEIKKTNALIIQAGYNKVIHFRPPYGKKLFILPCYLHKNRITTVTWDVAPESYLAANANPGEISEYVVENTKPGSIILLHVMFKPRANSMAAVPSIIKKLKTKGYRFVTISELIENANA